MSRQPNRKVTVEDLIRLKRAEKPEAAFWEHFDAEMRAKQLAAIVGRKPWWVGIHRRIFVSVSRNPFPLGAAAALALTYAGVRYTSEAPAPTVHESRVVGVATVRVESAPAPVGEAVQPRHEVPAAVAVAEAPKPSKPLIQATASHVVPMPQVPISLDVPAKSPLADGFSATAADFREVTQVALVRTSFGSDGDFEASVSPARPAAADPLARLDPAAERRARLLAPALPSSSRAPSSDWIRERTASDDRIYESMDRVASDRGLTGIRF